MLLAYLLMKGYTRVKKSIVFQEPVLSGAQYNSFLNIIKLWAICDNQMNIPKIRVFYTSRIHMPQPSIFNAHLSTSYLVYNHLTLDFYSP